MAVYTQDFSATGSPLGGFWTDERPARDFNTIGGAAVPADLNLDTAYFYNQPVGADQYVQAAISVSGGASGEGIGVSVRNIGVINSDTYYRCVVSKAGAANVVLTRIVAGTGSTTGLSSSTRTTVWVDTDILRVEVSGNGATVTIRIYQNGVQLGADILDTDSARLLSGLIGIAYSSTATTASLDNWSGGDLVATVTPFWTQDTILSQVGGRSKEFGAKARMQHSLWFAPQDVTFTPPVTSTVTQFPLDTGQVQRGITRDKQRTLLANTSLWFGGQDQGLPVITPDSYQPPVQTSAYWDSIEDRKNRALFSTFLGWNAGDIITNLVQQHTYTQPVQVSPLFDAQRYSRSLVVAKNLLFHLDTSISFLPTQPDTFIQVVQGTDNLVKGKGRFSTNLKLVNPLLWGTPEDISVAPPPPDTYIQSVQGVLNLGVVNKAFLTRSRGLSVLSWQRSRDESSITPAVHVYTQEIAGLKSVENARQFFNRNALRSNTRLWENYPYLSVIVPPPTIAPVLSLTSIVGSLVLDWSNIVGAIFYNIYKGLHSGQEQFYTTALGTEYIDTNVTKGITYFYYVTAFIILESAPSNEVYGVVKPGTSLEVVATGVDRERRGEEWYTCDRCGVWYPRSKMMNQNGLNVCTGSGTRNCWDKSSHSVAERQLDIPYEERPEPLPWTDEEL